MVSGVTMRGYSASLRAARARNGRRATWARPTPMATSTCAAGSRNMYITSFGRNVAPEWVEREIALEPGIRHVMVHGEARPYAVAIVSASRDGADAATIDRAIAAANTGCRTTRRCAAGRARPSCSPSRTGC